MKLEIFVKQINAIKKLYNIFNEKGLDEIINIQNDLIESLNDEFSLKKTSEYGSEIEFYIYGTNFGEKNNEIYKDGKIFARIITPEDLYRNITGTLEMEKKMCSRCQKIKPFHEFYPSKRTNDGRRYWCKSCISKYKSERYKSENYQKRKKEDPDWYEAIKTKNLERWRNSQNFQSER